MAKKSRPEKYERIAMACQGGGSLGAYHMGVLKAMEELGYSPDVVAVVSIGAFTAALIAGNDPKDRASQDGEVLGENFMARISRSWRCFNRDTKAPQYTFLPTRFFLWSAKFLHTAHPPTFLTTKRNISCH